MKFSNHKFSLHIDSTGAITSLEGIGKQFIKQRLPLFVFQLRDGDFTQILTSDDAKTIELSSTGNITEIKCEFANINFYIKFCFSDRIEATFSFSNHTGKYVEWGRVLLPRSTKRPDKYRW